MNHHAFSFHGETLHALASGALYWPTQKLLCVSDLHFGKAQRYAQIGASTLPPYETHDTLMRLDHDIAALKPETVICLGDSFDRADASFEIDHNARDWIIRLQAGRRWIWIEGNHDPGPMNLGGTHLSKFKAGSLVFRHIAKERDALTGEVSGHYHPKLTLTLKGRAITRRCFATDRHRIIMPAFGTYTGGLSVMSEPLYSLFETGALCILTGKQANVVPRPMLAD